MNGEALNVIGHPSCPGRFRRDADRTVFPPETVVMLPPVTPDLRPVLDTLLTRIRNRQDIELSVNDWGTLSVFADMKKRGELACMLTAGVLLAGQDPDPVLLRLTRRQPDRIILDGNENCLLSWNPPFAGAAPPLEHTVRFYHEGCADGLGRQPVGALRAAFSVS